MLIFGCCVGPSGKFEKIAEPGLQAVMAPDDVLIREDGRDGICAAYNRILTTARETPGCDGVVLIHDDVALSGNARQVIVEALAQDNVGIVGVVGGRGPFGPMWTESRAVAGMVNDSSATHNQIGPVRDSVDIVDGLLLAISPRAFMTLDFDPVGLPAFHGYDTDYCLRTRDAGLEVRVEPIPYRHHDKAGFGDLDAFTQSSNHLRRTWPQWIRPLTAKEKMRRELQLGRIRHRLGTTAKALRRGELPKKSTWGA